MNDNGDHKIHGLGAYSVSGTRLNTLHILSHLILIETMYGRYYYLSTL